MTPGYARPRSALPWLPYESIDRVIINAHNFTASGPTLLGNEIAIWCPSLDDTGNGTTTLNDLAGTNDITLTNLALSGSSSNWVNDTDNGGIRAIAFDGVNDYGIAASNSSFNPTDLTISFWMKGNETPVNFMSVLWNSTRPADAWNFGWGFYWTNSTTLRFFRSTWNVAGVNFTVSTPSAWNHICVVNSGTSLTAYVNGVSAGTGTTNAKTSGSAFTIGEGSSSTYNFACRLDDIRIFSDAKSSGNAVSLASKRGY